ncbi:MAG TPA: YiiD C-terminal domain-containing protein [Chitinophagaceae bacterium]|nr:YiiD C-terminal domain-containing protein [Chitinophagaceae bacterium]
MEILNLPLSQKFGIKISSNPEYLLEFNYSPFVKNHINTFHGGALYIFAETSSGFFLNENFQNLFDNIHPMLRSSKIKFSKPCQGHIYSKAKFLETSKEKIFLELQQNNKSLFITDITLYNESKNIICRGDFEWLVNV